MARLIPFLYAAWSLTYGLLALYAALFGRRGRVGLVLIGAILLTALWAATIASFPAIPFSRMAGGLELARDAAWYGFGLFLLPPPTSGLRPFRQTLLALGLLCAILAVFAVFTDAVPEGDLAITSPAIAARLGFAIANLLLIENLYRNTRIEQRWHINLLVIAIGALFVYDLMLYADAIMFRRFSAPLFAGRAIIAIGLAPLIALAVRRNRKRGIAVQISRSVVFHTTTLLASGIFLLALAGAGEVFRHFGANWGVLAETCLLFGGIVVIAVLLSSGSARSRLKSLFVDHFFTSRYDYRQEWMRCITALATPDPAVTLHERVIRATAEVVDSPGGVLFLRAAGEAGFHWAGSLNLPPAGVMLGSDHPLFARLDAGESIIVADPAAEPWIEEYPPLWLAVPLVHAGQLIGAILLAPPRAPFRLDGEVFTLLRTIGQQVAVFIAEQRAAQALVETRHLREYGQRFAFIAHDIKNVSSQLSLLLANAEFHLDNPEFQRDMLATVRAAAAKISTLLVRLNAPEAEAAPVGIAPVERIAAIVATLRQSRGVPIAITRADRQTGKIAMPLEAFDAVITHLLDNALDAEESAGRPGHVELRIVAMENEAVIEISDRGVGMTPAFIRDELFRPFRTSKRTGSGIGAFQARSLVEKSGGSLHVRSIEGTGTTIRLSLPLLASVEAA